MNGGRALLVVLVAWCLASPAGAATHLVYNDVFPCRLVDTRDGSGASDEAAGALPNPGPHHFRIQGFCGVPDGAAAAVVNFAVLFPSQGGDLRAFPFGGSANVSVMNYQAAVNLANGATVPLAAVAAPADRDLSVLIGMGGTGNLHLLIDVMGYYGPGTGAFLPLAGGTMTGTIDSTDPGIVNAIQLEDNAVVGDLATINFRNFDVAASGAMV